MLRWIVILGLATTCSGWFGGIGGAATAAEGDSLVADDARLAPRETVEYDVADLVKDAPQSEAAAAVLRDMIVAVIAPVTWEDVGGQASIELSGEKGKHILSIKQTKTVHAQIRKLLHDLRALQSKNPPPLLQEDAAAETARKKIDDALASPTSIEFTETPLADVLEYLQDTHKIPSVIDRKALAEEGIKVETEMTCSARDMSLRSGLNHLLRPLDLKWFVRDGAVVITTWQAADEFLEVAVYDLGDLIEQGADQRRGIREIEDLMRSMVSPTIWMDVEPSENGQRYQCSSIVTWDLGQCRAIVVSSRRDVHAQIQELLHELRKLQARPTGQSVPQSADEKAQSRIAAALDSPTEMECEDESISEVLEYLEDLHQIPIMIDRKAWDDWDIDIDTPVTCNFHRISLRSALTHVLGPLELSWDIQDETMLITSQERCACNFSVVAYDVTDIVGTHRAVPEGLDRLCSMICEIVDPSSWDCVGGPGSLGTFVMKDRSALFVLQTQPTHDAIARFLAQLRAAMVGKPSLGRPPAEERIRKALDESISVRFTATPLREVLDYLAADI